MNEIALSLVLVVSGFSLLLFITALISATRVKSIKTTLLAAGFLFYFLKEVYLLYLVLSPGFSSQSLVIGLSVADLIVLLFFYASVLK